MEKETEELTFEEKLKTMTFDIDKIDKTIRASKASVVQVAKSLVSELAFLDRKRDKEDFDFELIDFMELNLLPLLDELQTILFTYRDETDYFFLSKVFFEMPPRNGRLKRMPYKTSFKNNKEKFYKEKAELDARNRYIQQLNNFTRFDRIDLGKCRTRVLLSLLEKKMYILDSHYGDGHMFYWENDEKKSIGSGNAAISMMAHNSLLPKITEINKKYCEMMDEYKIKREIMKHENGEEDKSKKLSWRKKDNGDVKESNSEKQYTSYEKKKSYKPSFKKVKADEKLSWRRRV